MQTKSLTPQQSNYIHKYSDPSSPSFGNSYRSALSAGYSDQTSKNLTHLKPKWLSESIGIIKPIDPEQITQVLTSVIYNPEEPTYIKLKALELMMKSYNMLKQHEESQIKTVCLSINLTGDPAPR
jgi:hypothetical protein